MLEFGEGPTPKPGAGEVLVDVEAAGVNFIDTYRRSGVYPMEYPHIACKEGTGRIAEVGEGVESWQVCDRVAWHEAQGSYAMQVVVNTDNILRVPECVSTEVAAAMPLQGLIVIYLSEEIDQAMLDHFSLVVAVASGDWLHLRWSALLSAISRAIRTVANDESVNSSSALNRLWCVTVWQKDLRESIVSTDDHIGAEGIRCI